MVSTYFAHDRVENLVVLIDGNALIHRGFHALPQTMRTRAGELVNAVYGFTMVLLQVLNTVRPKYIVCTFDLPGKTFRHERYAAYKAKRVKAPQELYDQIPRVKEVVRALNIPIFEREGFEADDVIGTLSRAICKMNGCSVLVVTGDMDTLQLVNDCVHVLTLRKGMKDVVEYDVDAVKEKYGIAPESVVDFKGLRGDPSDNIPGVKGIGEKTARTLVARFGSLERLYEASREDLEEAVSPRIAELLLSQREAAFESRDLATIRCDLELPFSLEDARVSSYDHLVAAALFGELEFRSLLAKLPYTMNGTSPSEKKRTERDPRAILQRHDERHSERAKKVRSGTYSLVDDEQTLRELVAKLARASGFVFDTETTSLDPLRADLLGISFAIDEGRAWYVDVVGIGLLSVKALLSPLFADERIEKWGHHLKYDLHVLERAGFVVRGTMFDTMIASYVLDSSRKNHGLDQLAFTEFGYEMQSITELIGPKGASQKNMRDVPVADVVFYSCEDADFTLRLKVLYERRLREEKLEGVFQTYDMPLVPILISMERAGVALDVAHLRAMNTTLERRLKTLESKIWASVGREFNINSTTQLREILFDHLKIDTAGIRKGKTGYSTAVSELEKLRGRHPMIELLFEYRELEKLRNTYVVPLPDLVDAQSRIHTTFNQTVTATGRLSSDSPNLQNIPVRTEIGRTLRNAFVAQRGYRFVALDYSQIELRIVAALSGDEAMVSVFRSGGDIHRATAARVHGIPENEVTKEQRYAAKSLNFGVLYGMGPYGFARDAGVSREEARAFIETYMAQFPKLAAWIDEQKRRARETEYAVTATGRRRFLPDIRSSNFSVRGAAERMAVNMPAQGLAADIMKKAMIDVFPVVVKNYPDARMVLQVHDELVFEVPMEDVSSFALDVAVIMEGAYALDVPLVVESSVGKCWGEMERLARTPK